MNYIFFVSSGSYSDYSIHAVFTARELAKQWIERVSGKLDDYQIEECPLDPVASEKPAAWQVVMEKDGNVVSTSSQIDDGIGELKLERSVAISHWGSKQLRLVCMVLTSDEFAAVKTTNEMRQHILVLNRWPQTLESQYTPGTAFDPRTLEIIK